MALRRSSSKQADVGWVRHLGGDGEGSAARLKRNMSEDGKDCIAHPLTGVSLEIPHRLPIGDYTSPKLYA
ncbi:hypothetical protein Thiowin_01362 [Thiorhodovibrio winogradskyi]|uniref:Uncharacterized protein n=1 Tax=Thiorhodovibrio winogradskyi TaxID=77007 RepID=A0ABZ0S810_9GAMM